jgi:hypothetical protein
MTPRWFTALTGRAPALERLSETGRLNDALGTAWAGYYADRALLVLTFPWLLIRLRTRLVLAQLPPSFYEPEPWLGKLLFGEQPGAAVWYALFAAVAVSALICLFRPRLIAARLTLAVGAVLLIAPEFGWKVDHMNHLFLLAHLYAIFLPIARPIPATAEAQAGAVAWYRTGVLFPYTMAGLWKFVDMTARRVLKPGMSWLDPDAMVITSIVNYRSLDLPLTVPEALDAFKGWIPIGYVALALVFAAAALSAWRRPLIALVLPTIITFHLSNVFTLHVRFISTCFVALAVLLPYDRLIPGVRRHLQPAEIDFDGRGAEAHYTRRYANGDRDEFQAFYAYRARIEDVSWFLAAPLHYPGVAWMASRVLRRSPSTGMNHFYD